MLNLTATVGLCFWILGAASCSGTAGGPMGGSGGARSQDAGDASAVGPGQDGSNIADAPREGNATGRTCVVDTDCASLATTPPACAVGKCDSSQHICTYAAKDVDGDGHPTSKCKANDGTLVVVGDDCDDTDPTIHVGSWDGPMGDGNPDRCDGIDQDCDSIADDGRLASGQTCTCTPNDVRRCSEDAGGQPIRFPRLDTNGNPLGMYCKIGKQTCLAQGQWGPCIGAVAPLPADLCDGLDENCNGLVDMNDTVPPVGQITYTFDGDLDNHAASGTSDAKRNGCPGAPPATCPSYYKGACKASAQWRTGTFPLDDCNDNDANAYPGAQEKCNGVDDDCNGVIDDNAVDAKSWVFDWDADGYGDINVKPEKSCTRPTTVPTACTQALSQVPSTYCKGLTGEGNAPACPPAPCAASMWVTGLSATDCKDNPGQGGATEGNRPDLVHPGGADLCNGLDYACQGTPDIGCGCAPVGSTKTCGDAQTCNAGTATCAPGGTWGSCNGGDSKQRLDYCMDFDSDGFCDLANCKTAACPADALASAGWKQKSLCNPVGDCNDKDASTFPASIETCNGDGKDHNCNKIPNTPGAGDCDCIASGPNSQTIVDCKPPVGFYPPAATPGDPSKGTPGHVLGSPLQGVCRWGAAVCNPTGRLGACSGASPGQSTEQCNGDGKDYDCNGVINTQMPGDCGCTNGASRDCGTCLAGSQSCTGGQWGTCLGAPSNVGQKCNVDNKNAGACLDGGTLTCDSNNPAVPKCVPDAVRIDQPQRDQGGDPAATTPAPNGSFDWDCDGTVETSFPAPTFNVFDSCGDSGATWCGTWFNGTSKSLCENGGAPYLLAPTAVCGIGSCTPNVCDFGPSPACGHKLIVVNCQWSTAAGGTCSPRIPPSLTPFVEGCT